MKTSRKVLLAAALLLGAVTAGAQVSPTTSAAPPPGSVPLSNLITTVAQKTGKKFVLDPRVRTDVTLVGEDPSSVTYDQLLTILHTYGFTAVETGGYVQVVPLAMVRMEPLPIVSGNEQRPDDQDVTAVIHVKSVPAGWLVPILRPLVPQWGHFAALPCANSLIIIDSFANVRRLEAIIKALDTGTPIKPPSCVVPMPRPWGSVGPRPPAAAPAPHPAAP